MKCELLLIDDEPCILESLAELLTEDDIAVTTALNGKEALNLLQSRSFDIVISDISMPVMDGPTLLEKTRASGIFTPFIFFSAHISEERKKVLKTLGASAIVLKPHFEILSSEINSLLVRKEFLEATTLLLVERETEIVI